jgi:hypothetical protein
MVKGEKTQDWNPAPEIASLAKSLTGILISELDAGSWFLPRPQAIESTILFHVSSSLFKVSKPSYLRENSRSVINSIVYGDEKIIKKFLKHPGLWDVKA